MATTGAAPDAKIGEAELAPLLDMHLAMRSGEQLTITSEGRAFLAYVARATG